MSIQNLYDKFVNTEIENRKYKCFKVVCYKVVFFFNKLFAPTKPDELVCKMLLKNVMPTQKTCLSQFMWN